MSVPAPQGRSLLTSGAGQGLRGLPMSHGRAELVVVAAGPVVAAAPPAPYPGVAGSGHAYRRIRPRRPPDGHSQHGPI